MLEKPIKFFFITSLIVFITMTFSLTLQSKSRYDELAKLRTEREEINKRIEYVGENLNNIIETKEKLNETIVKLESQIIFQQEEFQEERDNFFARNGELNKIKLNEPTGFSLEEIESLVEDTMLEGIGFFVYVLAREFNVNEVFIISVAQLESAHGSSQIARLKNNLFGLNAWGNSGQEIFDRAIHFETKEDSVAYFAALMNERYFSKGLTTFNSICAVYAEDPLWGQKISTIYNWNISKLMKGE